MCAFIRSPDVPRLSFSICVGEWARVHIPIVCHRNPYRIFFCVVFFFCPFSSICWQRRYRDKLYLRQTDSHMRAFRLAIFNDWGGEMLGELLGERRRNILPMYNTEHFRFSSRDFRCSVVWQIATWTERILMDIYIYIYRTVSSFLNQNIAQNKSTFYMWNTIMETIRRISANVMGANGKKCNTRNELTGNNIYYFISMILFKCYL